MLAAIAAVRARSKAICRLLGVEESRADDFFDDGPSSSERLVLFALPHGLLKTGSSGR